MEILNSILNGLKLALPSAVAMAIILIVLFVTRTFIDKKYAKIADQQFRRQAITLAISFIGLLAIIMVLPISDGTRGQLLSLIGILLSAAIALSSATLIGNIMAGIMLRAIRHLRSGDFILAGDHFGRVTERGLFHVEIQTEERDLTTLPNIYLATNPVKVIRSSGTIVSAEISLGYDLPRSHIRDLLLDAARQTGLEEPFVHVKDLGDFSITYRVAGMLMEIKNLISVRSRLREMMLDNLHEGGIEIVSPTFMNTRSLAADRRFIPPVTKDAATESESLPKPEKIFFDKADEAESLERLREIYGEASKEIELLKKQRSDSDSDVARLKIDDSIEILEMRKKRLEEIIKTREEKE